MGLRTATMLTGLVLQIFMHRLRASMAGAGALLGALAIGLTGIGTIGTAIALQSSPAQPKTTASTPHTRNAPEPENASVHALHRSEPVKLSIPAIGVDSNLIQVGLNDDGTLETPKGDQYDNAAWYNGSPTPGQYGAAVIEGHVDHYLNGASVFYRLGEMQPGDRIRVDRLDGSVAEFAVTEIGSYPKDAFPTDRVYTSPNNEPELRLITCGGEFDSTAGDYTSNTVVFARLLEKGQ